MKMPEQRQTHQRMTTYQQEQYHIQKTLSVLILVGLILLVIILWAALR